MSIGLAEPDSIEGCSLHASLRVQAQCHPAENSGNIQSAIPPPILHSHHPIRCFVAVCGNNGMMSIMGKGFDDGATTVTGVLNFPCKFIWSLLNPNLDLDLLLPSDRGLSQAVQTQDTAPSTAFARLEDTFIRQTTSRRSPFPQLRPLRAITHGSDRFLPMVIPNP